jgi:predicted nuclease with TOPRIM domain
MKKMMALLVLIISTYTFAGPKKDFQDTMNKMSEYESKLRKSQAELMLKTAQVDKSTKQLMQLNNEYSLLSSRYRQLAGQVQYLKFQNDQLIEALKSADSFTPELAKKVDSLKGRLPASTVPKK